MICGDTETTGLLAPMPASLHAQPYITEIFLIKFNEDTYEVDDEFYSLVKPRIPIPELITKLTGIDDNTVKDAPFFVEIYDQLCDFFVGEKEIVGHNIMFDLGVIQHELERHNLQFRFPWPCKLHDTVEMSFPIFNKRLKLGQLYEHCYGEPIEGVHRARNDGIANAKCYKWLKENGY